MRKEDTIDALDWMQQEMDADPDLGKLVEEEYRRLKLAYTIQVLREDSGLTQAELAECIGTSQPAIARIESGSQARVSIPTLLKISQALGVKLEIKFKRSKRIPKQQKTSMRVESA